jgi:hypothetical protein
VVAGGKASGPPGAFVDPAANKNATKNAKKRAAKAKKSAEEP